MTTGATNEPGAIEERAITAGGLLWECGVQGPESGPPVVLLHGFPEYWRTWTKVMPPLAAAGFRVYAPSLPGYGMTDPPKSYALDDLAGLIAAFADEVGGGRAHLVGHDWGGIVGCAAAALHPESFRSAAVACCAHPRAFSTAWNNPEQILRSWYVLAFQIPGIEKVIGRKDVLERGTKVAVTDIDDPDAMARALEYYRTNLRPWNLNSSSAGTVPIPGLVLHAKRDVGITEAMMRATAEQFDDLRAFEVMDSGHFVQRTRPDAMLEYLLPFLRTVEDASER